MSPIRKRIAAVAVVLALGGLGGVAWGSHPAAHHAAPASAVKQSSSSARPVSTGTSGAVLTPAVNTQPFPGATSVGGRRDD